MFMTNYRTSLDIVVIKEDGIIIKLILVLNYP